MSSDATGTKVGAREQKEEMEMPKFSDFPSDTELSMIQRDLTRYRLSVARQKLINSKEYNFNQRSINELRNILERWTLSVIDTDKKDPWEAGYILDGLSSTTKMRSEMREKGIPLNVINALTTKIINMRIKSTSITPWPCILPNGQIEFAREYVSRAPKSRVQLLLKLLQASSPEKAGVIEVGCMMMRYDALMAGSQQWAVPLAVYRRLVEKYGINLEGFAGPLNSQLLEIVPPEQSLKGVYCSIFPEDAPLGSLGNFFACDISKKRCVINPPFIESVIEAVVAKLEKILATDTKSEGCWLVVVPSWKDAKFYKSLKQLSQNVNTQIRRPPNLNTQIIELKSSDHYYYEDLSSEPKKAIPAKFDSTWFCFGFGIDTLTKADLI
jgi:hypothetical protein